MSEQRTDAVPEITMSMVVLNADGTVKEDHGVVNHWKPNDDDDPKRKGLLRIVDAYRKKGN